MKAAYIARFKLATLRQLHASVPTFCLSTILLQSQISVSVTPCTLDGPSPVLVITAKHWYFHVNECSFTKVLGSTKVYIL